MPLTKLKKLKAEPC